MVALQPICYIYLVGVSRAPSTIVSYLAISSTTSFVWEYHCFWCSVSQHQYNYSTCFRCAGNVTSNHSLSSFLPVLYVSHLSSFLPFYTSGICHRSYRFHDHSSPIVPASFYTSGILSFLPFYTLVISHRSYHFINHLHVVVNLLIFPNIQNYIFQTTKKNTVA